MEFLLLEAIFWTYNSNWSLNSLYSHLECTWNLVVCTFNTVVDAVYPSKFYNIFFLLSQSYLLKHDTTNNPYGI